MGNKQPKEISTVLTPKRSFFENVHYRINFSLFSF
jgi:hypothetical protein